MDITPALLLYFFLKSLLPVIAKDAATSTPLNNEESISKVQQFELIYMQLEYLYYVIPNYSCLHYFTQDKPGESNAVDGLIRNVTQFQLGYPLPYQGNTYGLRPSFSHFTGTSATPTPSYAGYYANNPAPPPNPPMQGSQCSPCTSDATSTSQPPYKNTTQGNLYFSFPTPSQNNTTHQRNAGVNFFDPLFSQ